MADQMAERLSTLGETMAQTLGRRVDRIVGDLSDGAGFDTVESPAAEIFGAASAFRQVIDDLLEAEQRASATRAAMLQLEARGAEDDVVRAAEDQARRAADHFEGLVSTFERMVAGFKTSRRRSR